MFKEVNRDNLCQVSLTGIRSLVLLGMLIESPRSLEEIRENFLQYNIIEDSNSDDIIRIDLNTLRSIGCVISRADKKTGHKFILTEHPFCIDITKDEMSTLKRAFNKLKPTLNINKILMYDNLFKKIAKSVKDKALSEELYGLTSLKHYNISLINELLEYCKANKIINFIYKSPASDNEIEKNIECKEVLLKNNKIYLCGFDLDLKKAITLNIDRIKKILSHNDCDNSNTIEKVKVKFALKNFTVLGLNDDEKILEGNLDKGFIIEGNYYNEFIAFQRILSFGSDCTVLEPKDFKESIIERLQKIKEIYKND